MADRFRELLKTRDYIIFDGAMGTMLQAAGMKMGETPEVLNITRPELLVSIAGQYYNAGSDVVYANLVQTDISLKNAEKVLRSL